MIHNVHHLTQGQSLVTVTAMTIVVTVRSVMSLGSVYLTPSVNAQIFKPIQSPLLRIRILLLSQTAADLTVAAISASTPQLAGL